MEWPISSVARLVCTFKPVAAKAGLGFDLDLYGLRHRFRSDLLELKVSNHLINYLMGHERPGDEAYNYYLERNLTGLVPAYEDAVRKIAAKYGVFE
jgi:site-specific recombinase XerD